MNTLMKKLITILIVTLVLYGIIHIFYIPGKAGRWSKEWEDKFEAFQPSEKIMDIIGVRQGLYVGEIGAASGRFAVKVAARVGHTGKVFANDIDEHAINFMKKRRKRERITNMEVIHSKEIDPCFPMGQLDLVYIINTYDDLSDPVNLLKNIIPSLKADGRLAVICYDPKKLKDHRGHAISPDVIIRQARSAGFKLIHVDKSFELDNIYIFTLDE